MEDIKVGDVVHFKSETYNWMTVEDINETVVQCVFFDKDGVFKRITVSIHVLTKH